MLLAGASPGVVRQIIELRLESIRPAALRRMYERAERKLWDPALRQSDRIELLQAIVVLKTAEHVALYELARAELPPR